MATRELTSTPRRADHAASRPALSAVTRYTAAAARFDELNACRADTLSPDELAAFWDAQLTVTEQFGVLADAGMTHLVREV